MHVFTAVRSVLMLAGLCLTACKSASEPKIEFQLGSRICIYTTVSPALMKLAPDSQSGVDGLSYELSRSLDAQMEARGVSTGSPTGEGRTVTGLTSVAASCPNNGVHILIHQYVDVNRNGRPYRISLDVRQGRARWTTTIERLSEKDWPYRPLDILLVVTPQNAIAGDSYAIGQLLANFLFD